MQVHWYDTCSKHSEIQTVFLWDKIPQSSDYVNPKNWFYEIPVLKLNPINGFFLCFSMNFGNFKVFSFKTISVFIGYFLFIPQVLCLSCFDCNNDYDWIVLRLFHIDLRGSKVSLILAQWEWTKEEAWYLLYKMTTQ